jgi:hypothetical protein
MRYYDDDYEVEQEPEVAAPVEEYGCKLCWDKRVKKEKELYFFDSANNMRICHYCPYCGRKYLTEED